MFTVIIPNFNHEGMIWYAIQSVLNQTYQNFKIFVVGDGASTRTKEIVNEIKNDREVVLEKATKIDYFLPV